MQYVTVFTAAENLNNFGVVPILMVFSLTMELIELTTVKDMWLAMLCLVVNAVTMPNVT